MKNKIKIIITVIIVFLAFPTFTDARVIEHKIGQVSNEGGSVYLTNSNGKKLIGNTCEGFDYENSDQTFCVSHSNSSGVRSNYYCDGNATRLEDCVSNDNFLTEHWNKSEYVTMGNTWTWCYSGSPKYTGSGNYTTVDAQTSFSLEPIYDIAYANIEGSQYKLYGWAFIKGLTNYLGLYDSREYGTKIELALVKGINTETDNYQYKLENTLKNEALNGKDYIKATITYAQEGDKAGYNTTQSAWKNTGRYYYDLTDWFCSKEEKQDYLDMSISDKEWPSSLNDYTSLYYPADRSCKKNSAKYQGGFEASFDLSKLEKGEYYLYIKINSKHIDNSGSRIPGNNEWIKVSASNLVKGNTSYKQANKQSVVATGFSNKATIKDNYTMIYSHMGLFCGALGVQTYKRTAPILYFEPGTYTVEESYMANTYKSFKRQSNNVSGAEHYTDSKYYISMYPLIVDAGNISGNYTDGKKAINALLGQMYQSRLKDPYSSPGTNITHLGPGGNTSKKLNNKDALLPGETENLEGNLGYVPAGSVEFDGHLSVKILTQNASDETLSCKEGEQIYTNYYLFLASLNEKSDYMTNTATSSLFNDTEIFKNLGINSLNAISKVGNVLPIDKTNIGDFYTWWDQVQNSDSGYYRTGNNFYLTHTKYCDINNVCYDSKELKIGSNRNRYINASVSATIANVTLGNNNSNNGFAFSIDRVFELDKKSVSLSNNPAPFNTWGEYFHPLIYELKFCKSDAPKCEDTVNKAVCHSSDIGTKVVFHENDDLKTCTIPKGTDSGFKLLNSKETTAKYNDKTYCEVACKDDFDIELPTTKQTAAGQYFVLNNYAPKIDVKRTCVTTKLDYSEFEKDLKSAEEDMIEAYNTWQDYKHILENLKGDSSETKTTCTYTYCCEYKDVTDESGNTSTVCSGTCSSEEPYTIEDWTINSVNAINNPSLNFSGDSDHYESGNACNSPEGVTYDSAYNSYKTQYTNLTNSAQNAYNTARKEYEQLNSIYHSCTDWPTKTDTKLNYQNKLNMTLEYSDPDNSFANNPIKFNGTSSKTDTSVKYWRQGTETNNNYTEGGNDSISTVTKNLISCVGTTCNASDRTKNNTYITNSYIKREEKVTYNYKLPTVSVMVPSGAIVNSGSSSSNPTISLEDNAVPVNINTVAGLKNYTIKITDVDDKVRLARKSTNKSIERDNFNERFANNALNNSNGSYVCHYKVVNDIYLPDKKQLNFFYRTVDLDDINPNNRDLGYNWTSPKANKIRESMKASAQDYQELTNSKDREKFSFTLTPAIMKQIRNYNSTRNNKADGGYSDWDLVCENTDDPIRYHCKSNFLTCLASGGRQSETGEASCNQIFGNVLNNYNEISNYNDTELNTNRNLLIKKQQKLGGSS